MSATKETGLNPEDVQRIKDILGNSTHRSRAVLDLLRETATPFEVFVTLALSVAATARMLDLEREEVLAGVGAAFDSIQVEAHHVQ